ncbi:MAG: class I SAM-dependent methyltransferase [Candidatus Nezhaarchaeota archaeon]|nr:class I SAM-dependent methyltransferase [Candidatus Nezhaarchaeota archaeon]
MIFGFEGYRFVRSRKARLRRLYDLTSEFYEELYGGEQEKKFASIISLDPLKFSKFNVVLDAGCGTGLITKKLLGRGDFIVGVDFSKGMLQKAKEKLGKAAEVDFVLGDVEYLPFRSKSFDLVLSITVLQNCCPSRALKSLLRVLSKRGVLVLSSLKRSREVEKLEARLRDHVLKGLDPIDNIVILGGQQATNVNNNREIRVKPHGVAH